MPLMDYLNFLTLPNFCSCFIAVLDNNWFNVVTAAMIKEPEKYHVIYWGFWQVYFVLKVQGKLMTFFFGKC